MGDLRYPIGMYEPVLEVSGEDRKQLIREVEIQPAILRATVEKLTSEQMETPYRPGGWTIRQVVHHLADNNMNAYIRFKRGLTEDTPSSPSYREDLWAELPDYRQIPVGESLTLLDVLHRRFAVLLWALNPQDFRRTVAHSTLGVISLDTALHRFVWHNRHHIAQITRLCERMGW
ncbi:YfiT family bacillithiol transferase [Alicyclobacillus macrosporangiidus]|uniref:YfiT family bacillithiol transferase n=1 Tax=Alicyclobacillus macrosporangiidus TaxID=392015 RepID=UPI0004954C07|nr:putative metal-dependent hydrolase [Alicyclobacillus macrosporangiidus]